MAFRRNELDDMKRYNVRSIDDIYKEPEQLSAWQKKEVSSQKTSLLDRIILLVGDSEELYTLRHIARELGEQQNTTTSMIKKFPELFKKKLFQKKTIVFLTDQGEEHYYNLIEGRK